MSQQTDFITQYTKWFKDNSAQRFVNGFYEISTPFLDTHNDIIQFYVQRNDNEFFFTDDGYTLSDIQMSGLNLSSKKLKVLVDSLAASLNVEIIDGAITAKASSPSTVAQTEHKMIQAILKFSDMLYLLSPRVKGIFLDEVSTFFYDNDIRFTPSVMFSGKSGLPQRFDFVIPASRKEPERMILTLNNPSKQSVQSAIFSWNDVKETRRDKAVSYLIFNNKNTHNNSLIDAAKQYDINAFYWENRSEYIKELVS